MLEISNTRIYDLKECVIASRNAMRLTPPEYTDQEFEKSLPRAMQLAKCGGGSGHSNFRKGIRVSFDVKYPNYISPEMQRYGFLDIVTSSSKMHRLIQMDLDVSCNEYVTEESIKEMKRHVAVYNEINNNESVTTWVFRLRNGVVKRAENRKDALYYAFMMCISNCVQGIELFMRCSTNYEQLATIYKQRRHHKLREDWGAFCDWIQDLPYANELIIIK